MPRKPSVGEKPARRAETLKKEWKDTHPFTYVNISLTDDEKQFITEKTPSYSQIGEFMATMAMELGYKVGVSYNFEDKCYVLSVTGILYSRDDFNRCVTSRHSEFDVACSIAMYKHSEYCSDGIPAAKDKKIPGAVFD